MSELTWLPDPSEVLALYERVIQAKGGTAGPPKPGCVEGALGSATQAALYSADEGADEPDPALTAAYALRSLARNHCFPDGNKRVAWATAVDLFLRIGLAIEAPDDEVATLVEDAAQGILGPEELHAWFIAPGRLVPSVQAASGPVPEPQPQSAALPIRKDVAS